MKLEAKQCNSFDIKKLVFAIENTAAEWQNSKFK